MNTTVQLLPLECSDREQFISDNQEAFNYGAMEEFGLRDNHFEEEGQIISRDTIEQSIDGGEAYRIVLDGQKVGGIVIKVDGEKVTSIFFLFLRLSIAKASDMPLGALSKTTSGSERVGNGNTVF